MGRAFIEAFERAGIVTTPKHFLANVGEGGRDSYPIDHSERSADGALPAAVRRRGPPGARALGDDRLQLGGRRAGDAESRGCSTAS